MNSVWLAFDHALHSELKGWSLKGKTLVVAFSGGQDSVCLLESLRIIQPAHGFYLEAHFVHHGEGDLKSYRDQALEFCQGFCQDRSILLTLSQWQGAPLKSENALREFRYAELGKLECDFILTGHHANDQLETRLLHLIRGSGFQGLRGMQAERQKILRPLLDVPKTQIEEYVKAKNLPFLEDPSNSDTQYLRNWIRHRWLKDLEEKSPGATKALARSLEQIASDDNNKIADLVLAGGAISKPHWLKLSVAQQRSAIAEYLLSLGHSEFSRGQIDEVIKNLDKNQTRHTFQLGRLQWHVNAQQISVEQLV